MNYNTTRRYARSMAEAFADERASCIEIPYRRSVKESLLDWALAVAIGLALVLAIGLSI